MAEHVSLFHKLVTKEDDYTQLLYNLMVRYDDFRSEILSLFFEDKAAIANIKAKHLSTQLHLSASGRPDLVIDSPSVYALLEVKLSESRSLTTYQLPIMLERDDLNNYFSHVESQSRATRAILFLVPERWQFTKETQNALDKLTQQSPVKTRIVSWLTILGIAKRLIEGRPGIDEFQLLLTEKIAPLIFTQQETEMLFQKELPIREVMKLCFLIDQINAKCKGMFARIDGPKFYRHGDQYGFECYGIDKKSLFWFGIWTSFWLETGIPISFGIEENVTADVRTAFMRAHEGPTRKFAPYTLGWITEEDLLDAVDGDAEGKVWNRIKPILLAIQGATAQGN